MGAPLEARVFVVVEQREGVGCVRECFQHRSRKGRQQRERVESHKSIGREGVKNRGTESFLLLKDEGGR